MADRIDVVLREARARLPPGEADYLLAHALGRDTGWLFAHGSESLPPDIARRFADLMARRLQGTPVAYLTGVRGFWTLELAVSPDTLIPRPETERLVELALERLPTTPCDVADLGTGSGAIALAIASERPDARIIATDTSAAALAVARANAARHRLPNVQFSQGDWYAPLAGRRFDLIVSNPPYIAAGDPHLEDGDLRFEPAAALASGADGLDALRHIIIGASTHLGPGGWLLVEHGWKQGASVRALMTGAGLADVATARDLESRDRVSCGRT
ncbi:MAG: peptide chain release factor N(5)-glutamine methyltransferase [Lysobacter sp.]|nr:MAG: peptide chain release factor N(5)-glutamine methyltransferase [Lysobacter sp.]